MEFWGVEVKSGEPLRVESGDGFILHLSQACLGEAKKDKGNESVCIYVNFDDQKLVLGTLSHDKIPQIPFDLVFEKDFELSHNLKNGSVYFSGYKVAQPDTSDSDEFNSDGEEDLPFPVENEAKQPKPEEENPAKPDSKQKVKIVEPSKDGKPKPENDDSSDEEDDSSDDGESSDDPPMMMANDEDENSEDEDDKSDEDDDDSDDEDVKTPKKAAEVGKKRSTESASKSPVPDKKDKKAKFVTPQKTDFKKVGVHIATPHPSKQAAKTSANRQKMEQAQKSFSCSSCNRSFGSENALQSHSKAKHSAA